MKIRIPIAVAAISCATGSMAQSAIDAYRLSQPDMKGTARFMSMGGAFGALGGDLSTLSQNPAGIGVYRSNEIGFTVDLDCQNAMGESKGTSTSTDQTKFLLNNIGAVFTWRLPSAATPNFNIGFTYNKGTSFNREYAGRIPDLNTSLSNYIAGVSNNNRLTVGDVTTTPGFDPYNPNDGGYAAPWLSILGYDSYLTDPEHGGADPEWYGQWGNGTSGKGRFQVKESGSIDEFNIALGGNIYDVVYWGMNFDITNLNYTMRSIWGESLENAYVSDNSGNVARTSADWRLNNYYNVNGNGFNYQFGLIFKPIQELRIGVAVHTPTWYRLTETYLASTDYQYGNGLSGTAKTNDGYYGYNDVSFRTPMKLTGSLAGVIGGRFIISADYEWTPYDKMKYSSPGNYGFLNGGYDDDWDYDWDPWMAPKSKDAAGKPTKSGVFQNTDAYSETNGDIKAYYKSTNTIRLGAEFRVTPAFSVRAGYCNVSSPVKSGAANGNETIYTSGTMPNYRFDDNTRYLSCGLGYKYKHFYADLAYVNKHMTSTYHAFTPDVDYANHISYPSPQSKVSFDNNQIILSAGFRF